MAAPDRACAQLVTLASIVEKEAQVAHERPLIAAVYQNRLDRGIGLARRSDRDLRPQAPGPLERQHPARRPAHGLALQHLPLRRPPARGRSAPPALASLEAAADPADVPYLYFVSRNDGTHVFADTLTEHNRNVEQWQRRYWRERRQRERQAADKAAGTSGR